MFMRRTALLLFLCFNLFAMQNMHASNGFCTSLEKLCNQKNIDIDAFSNFFQKVNINVKKATDLGMYTKIFNWLNTPYRYGGKTKKGIDCSNYVFKLMNDCYDNYATSNQLSDLTEYVDREELKEGDLVFFNTNGYGISHVGVYLQDGKFTHSSSSQGVTISSLNEPYWDKRYCRAGRIIENK